MARYWYSFLLDCDRQGWVTNSGFVELERVQMILNELGRVEDQIFKKRQQDELQFRCFSKSQLLTSNIIK